MEHDLPQRRRLLTATIFTFAFMAGYAVAASMLGTLLPGIIPFYGLDLTAASAINITHEIGGIGAMILTLTVVDRMDKGRLMMSLAVVYGLILFFQGSAPPFFIFLCSRVAMGLVGVLVDNLTAAYISDLYGKHRARYISILHTLYALGALTAPKFAAFLYGVGGWNLAYLILGGTFAGLAILAVILFQFLGYPKTAVAPNAGHSAHIPYHEMFQSSNLRWLCLVSFLMAGQTYVSLWLSTYLNWLDPSIYTVDFCATIMTLFSVGMIMSRTGLAAIAIRVGAGVYLKWACLVSPLLLAGLILIGHPTVWLIGAFFYGLSSGAMYTAKVVLSCEAFPQYSATASAITGVCGTLGNIALNSIIGPAADAGYYSQSLLVAMALILICFFILQFRYRSNW